jgi:hypothetical protein
MDQGRGIKSFPFWECGKNSGIKGISGRNKSFFIIIIVSQD